MNKEPGEMAPDELVGEIYNTVNRLNSLVQAAADQHDFSIKWNVIDVARMEQLGPVPHLDMTVLTKAKC